MFSAAAACLRRIAINIEAKADKLDQRGLARAARADDDVEPDLRRHVEAVEKPFFDLDALDVQSLPLHPEQSDCTGCTNRPTAGRL